MEWISGSVFIQPMGGRHGLRAGGKFVDQGRAFDHTAICFAGRWWLRKWVPIVDERGEEVLDANGNKTWALVFDLERDGPFHLLLDANAKHEFTFLGMPVPEWMEPYLAKLSSEDAMSFRASHSLGVGRAWCVYSHRTPQGDVSETHTGWHEAYG